jgi:thiol-disulfide isomerase/thioredoxin
MVLSLLLMATLGTSPAQAGEDEAPWFGRDAAGQATVRLYFFWTETCPHCRKAQPFVDGLSQEFPWLEVRSVPLREDRPKNVLLFLQMTEALGESSPGVPAFLSCGRAVIGFASAESTGAALRQALVACHDSVGALSPPAAAPVAEEPIRLPIFGAVDPQSISLPLFTVMIAAVDAFNPCAFFVLMFLMSLLTHARDRQRMAIIGGLFVLTSGVLYFAFMAAWLNVFLVLGEVRWVTAIAALIALALAAINIKDFFWLGRGVSLSIPAAAKPGLYARMRALSVTESWPALVVGTVTLAVAANTYELLCTAGFPMLFTRVLTLRQISPSASYLYLALYNVIYVIPLLAIATAFLVTLGPRKLQEREGRILKLLSGLMMLGLGLALLLGPEWLSDIRVAAGIIVSAAVATAIIVRLERLRTQR